MMEADDEKFTVNEKLIYLGKYTHTRTCMHACTHTHTQTHTHIHTYTHTHTHTHTHCMHSTPVNIRSMEDKLKYINSVYLPLHTT